MVIAETMRSALSSIAVLITMSSFGSLTTSRWDSNSTNLAILSMFSMNLSTCSSVTYSVSLFRLMTFVNSFRISFESTRVASLLAITAGCAAGRLRRYSSDKRKRLAHGDAAQFVTHRLNQIDISCYNVLVATGPLVQLGLELGFKQLQHHQFKRLQMC